MSVPVPASELAKGDYSPVYGTIKTIVEHRNRKTDELESLDILFWNGQEENGVEPDRVFDMVQGWNPATGPEGSVRAGLAADHANE